MNMADCTVLLSMEAHSDQDLLLVRQRTRQIARRLCFKARAQAQLATAVAEVVRNAKTHAGGGRVTFLVNGAAPARKLQVEVRDEGPGLVDEGEGIGAARRLVDTLSIDADPGRGTTVLLAKLLPRRSQGISVSSLLEVADQLQRLEPLAPLEEVKEQNQELLEAMAALRRSQEVEAVRARDWQDTFDAIPDAICLLDDDFVLRRANQAAAALLDAPLEELLDRPWGELDPFDAGTVLRKARQTGRRACAEVKLRRRWYRLRVDPQLEAHGRPSRFVQLFIDVTDEKLASERLAQINEALKSYAHSISHDIKGPLAGAVTANQVLQQLLKQPLTEQTLAHIQQLGGVLSDSISRTMDLVNEVLALAETGSGPGGAARLDDVVHRVLEDRQEALEQAGMAAAVEGELGLVLAAPAHLYQIFGNLVDNALRHGVGPAAPAVRIRRLPGAPPGIHRFEVRDNGPGIPEELLPRVFEPFVKREGGGSGIGLATVRRIVAIYDGEIHARNEGGACIELLIHDQAP